MQLIEYIEKLQKFISTNPEAKYLTVIYASDAEGNNFHKVFNSPAFAVYDKKTDETEIMDDNIYGRANAIIIN